MLSLCISPEGEHAIIIRFMVTSELGNLLKKMAPSDK